MDTSNRLQRSGDQALLIMQQLAEPFPESKSLTLFPLQQEGYVLPELIDIPDHILR